MDDKRKLRVGVKILRSDRKSVAGRVLPDGGIEVRAPYSMTTGQIHAWLDRAGHKLMPLVNQCRKTNAYLAEHPFDYGGEVLFMGRWIPIKESAGGDAGLIAQYKDGAVMMKPGLSQADMRKQIGDLFCSLAKPVFEEKLNMFSRVMGASYRMWTIGSAKKAHGTCDSSGKITLSWRVIMMSEEVIDYIIVHELAHLKQMNHSKAFYDEMGSVLPDWKERKKAHRDYSHLLYCGGWI